MSKPVEIGIIGGGAVGIATALALTRRTPAGIVVFEAEAEVAAHQTGHNSGVIHSGLYYKPGSLKARTCTEGRRKLYEFCREHGVPNERCGKIVVAVSAEEVPALDELERRGRANGLEGLRRLDAAGLRELEPHVAGVAGLHVPETGIVDFAEVTRAYARLVRDAGREVRTSARVLKVIREVGRLVLETTAGEFDVKHLVNCGGLQSDRIAAMCGVNPKLKIIPFRGEYYGVVEGRRDVVRNLIYPVPDPRFPFLGVHFTRMIGGGVEAGPNAVLAFRREGYEKWSFSPRDSFDMAAYAGFWRMAGKYWRMACGEWRRSLSKSAFVRALQKLVPDIRDEDLAPAGAGVRAQAVDPSGALVDDFRIIESDRMIHVLNAPSPAATASLSIGETIADAALKNFDLRG
jgi:(S)-2-hydroxyglutarate dehydrogenase